MKIKKIKSISQLKKEADKVFSLWVRKREDYCITCGSRKNLQAGHYISRSCNQLRYDPRNVHTQCVSCNVFKRGAMDEYARMLIAKYGKNILDVFAKEKVKIKQWKANELEQIIKKYS
jgi:F0F1-type ATP synthase alpha subunit